MPSPAKSRSRSMPSAVVANAMAMVKAEYQASDHTNAARLPKWSETHPNRSVPTNMPANPAPAKTGMPFRPRLAAEKSPERTIPSEMYASMKRSYDSNQPPAEMRATSRNSPEVIGNASSRDATISARTDEVMREVLRASVACP